MRRFVWLDESFLSSWQKKQASFYLGIFFDFLDIGVVNSRIVDDKTDSIFGISAIEFLFSLTRSMMGKFLNKKRAAPMHRP